MNNILKFVIVLLLISISSFAFRDDSVTDETPKMLTYSEFKTPLKNEFYLLYNAYRTEMNLDTLVEDTVLVVAALQHSLWLGLLNQQISSADFMITHWEDVNVDWIPEMKTPKDRIDHYDTSIRGFIGENLDGKWNGEFTAKQIFEDWKNSPIHNEILLDPRAERMGLGLIRADKGGKMCNYVTLLVTN
jgi:hypothetical protein